MAAYGDEPVDGYFYSSYNPYAGRYPRPKDARWKYESYFSQYGDTSDAFNNQQRAQLKSILSQINPKLTPRLRKANTKDVAVQVNPRRDASVQCSIGPRTLLAMKRDFRRKNRPEPVTSPGGGGGSPKAAAGVRYPRTLAVYSPIAYRSVTSFLVDENNNDKEVSCSEVQTGEPASGPPESEGKSDGKKGEDEQAAEDGKGAKVIDLRKKVKLIKPVKSENTQPTTEGSEGKARVRFQVSYRWSLKARALTTRCPLRSRCSVKVTVYKWDTIAEVVPTPDSADSDSFTLINICGERPHSSVL